MSPPDCRAFLATALSIVLSHNASAAPIGIAVSDGELVTVDLENGASDSIGPLGFDSSIGSLDAAPDGTLFGLEGFGTMTRRLVRINRSTGAATVIGAVGSQEASGLAFDGAGRLFVADGPTLLEVDPATASTTTALDMGTEARALAPIDGDLYALRLGPVSGCELVLLEPDTGSVTQVLPDVPCAQSADGRDGVLWLVRFFSPILGLTIVVSHRLDLPTGVVEEAGSWSGLSGSNGFVVPTGLAEVGSPSLLPAVDIPALGGGALALFALALAAAALAHSQRAPGRPNRPG